MRLIDMLLIAIACLCAYAVIDTDGAAMVIERVSKTAVSFVRG